MNIFFANISHFLAQKTKATLLTFLLILSASSALAKEWVFVNQKEDLHMLYRLKFDEIGWRIVVDCCMDPSYYPLDTYEWVDVYDTPVTKVGIGGEKNIPILIFFNGSDEVVASIVCDNNGSNRKLYFEPIDDDKIKTVTSTTVSKDFLNSYNSLLQWVKTNAKGDLLQVTKGNYKKSGTTGGNASGKSTGKSTAKTSAKTSGKSTSKSTGKSTAKATEKPAAPKLPTRPQGFPSKIEILPETGKDTKCKFQFKSSGIQNKEYTIDLSAIPDKLPEIFNIPVSVNIGPSLDYLVSLGDYFYGTYMEESVYLNTTFYGTVISPHYRVQASEIFTADGKNNILTTSAIKLGDPIRIYFSQDENSAVKYLTIQLRLGLKQISGSSKMFDKSYEKKVCKEVNKYFKNLMTHFKKNGYKVQKLNNNEFTVTSSDWEVTFRNHLNDNFSYGDIGIQITKHI